MMTDFIRELLVFPTVFYGALLIVVVLYWLSAVLGFAELDVLEGDVELDVDGDTEASGISAWLTKFKLDGIPLTITLSLIILLSWVLCFVAVHFIYPLTPGGWVQILLGFWILLIAPIIAAVMVAPVLQPLKPIFRKSVAKSAADFTGQFATVRSGKVTADFGEAELSDGGAGLILKIRAAEPNTIKRGDKVKLQAYEADKNTWQVRIR